MSHCCTACDRRFNTSISLLQHLDFSAHAASYECDSCDREFDSQLAFCKRVDFAMSVEDEKLEISKVIRMMLMRNVSWTSSRSNLSWNLSSFHWDANLISVFIVLTIALYLWTSDFITLIVNFRCNDVLIAVIRFGQVILSLSPSRMRCRYAQQHDAFQESCGQGSRNLHVREDITCPGVRF